MKYKKNLEELWAMQKAKKFLFTHLHEEDFRFDYEKRLMIEQIQVKLGRSREELIHCFSDDDHPTLIPCARRYKTATLTFS